ncbi:MAG: hypothetical protein JWO03_3530 [Bacteroidetes bacterium]|nr:hypothetical protein [Bacteroidota bacterium]
MKTRYHIFFVLSLFLIGSVRAQAVVSDTMIKGYSARQYFSLIEEYYADENYEAALAICDTVLAYNPRLAQTYRYQSDIYFVQDRWSECVSASEKCLAIDSTSMPVLRNYFYAGHVVDSRSPFMEVYKRMYKIDPNFPHHLNIRAEAKTWENDNVWSYVGTGILIAGSVLIFFFFYYKGSPDPGDVTSFFRGLSLPYLLLVPAAVTCILYFLFFHFSPWIWSGNTHYPSLEYNLYTVRGCTFEHDGHEGIVLYALVLTAMCLSIGALFLLRYAGSRLRMVILFVLAAISFFFFIKIGFYPPFEAVAFVLPMVFVYTILFILAVWAINQLMVRYPRWQILIAALIIWPFCFLISDGFSVYDYGYTLSPALRLHHGDRIRDIYFQYDVFLSLLALVWIKLKWGIQYIYLLSEAGYYLFFLGLFIFSRKFFVNKKLPFLLLVAAVLVRYYANMTPNSIFQISPWRLDMWLVLLGLFYWRGAYHWLLALFLGSMIVFHRNFGFIYLAAYMQLLLVLLIADLTQVRSLKGAIDVLVRHFVLSIVNIGIIAMSFVCSYFVLGGVLPESALAYSKIGIGMMKISEISFYWYIPILLGAMALLLIRDHRRLSQRYLTTAVFLILLTIGNSIYFFGRSHEHNLINTSSVFILCFFVFLDILYQSGGTATSDSTAPHAKARWRLFNAIPFLFIILICLYYATSIGNKLRGLKVTRWAMDINFYQDYWGLKQATNSSDRIFFLEFDKDFLCYYNGNFKPVGYFTPNDAWVLKKDMVAMMQGLLDSSYYIVPTNTQFADPFITDLDYNAYLQQGYTEVFYKRPGRNMLDDRHAVMHRSFITTLPPRSIDVPAITLGRDFTVQCIIKPDTCIQHDSATIFTDLHSILGIQGMRMYCVDTQRSKYVFQYGSNTQVSTSQPFTLRPGVLHYVTITTGDSILSIYVNGVLSSTLSYGGDYANSDRPFKMGNKQRRDDGAFRGFIYEIEIDSSRISREEMMRNLARIQLKRDSL